MSDPQSPQSLNYWILTDTPISIKHYWSRVSQETEAKAKYEQWIKLYKSLIEHLRMRSEGAYNQHRIEKGVDHKIEGKIQSIIDESKGHETLGHTFQRWKLTWKFVPTPYNNDPLMNRVKGPEGVRVNLIHSWNLIKKIWCMEDQISGSMMTEFLHMLKSGGTHIKKQKSASIYNVFETILNIRNADAHSESFKVGKNDKGEDIERSLNLDSAYYELITPLIENAMLDCLQVLSRHQKLFEPALEIIETRTTQLGTETTVALLHGTGAKKTVKNLNKSPQVGSWWCYQKDSQTQDLTEYKLLYPLQREVLLPVISSNVTEKPTEDIPPLDAQKVGQKCNQVHQENSWNKEEQSTSHHNELKRVESDVQMREPSMESIKQKIQLITICFIAPEDRAEIKQSLFKELSNFVVQELKWEYYPIIINNFEDAHKIDQQLSHLLENTQIDLSFVLICGHGTKLKPPKSESYTSYIMCKDTNLSFIDQTTYEIEKLVQTINQNKNKSSTLLLIDACNIVLRDRLDATTKSFAALASSQEAEMYEGVGLLTRGFHTALKEYANEVHSHTIQQVINNTLRYVEKESNNRQIPILTKIGSTSFLNDLLPSNVSDHSVDSEYGLKEQMLSLCIQDQFSEKTLKELNTNFHNNSVDRQSELAFMVHVRLYEKLCRKFEKSDEDKHNLKTYEDLIMQRLADGNVSAIGEVTSRHLIAASTTQLNYLAKRRYLEQAQDRLSDIRRLEDRQALSGKINDTIGSLVRDQGNIISAIEHYQKSLEEKQTIEDYIGIEMSRQNLGWTFLAQGEFRDAASTFKDGVREVNKLLKKSKKENNFSLFSELNTSWTIHMYGRLITQLIDPTASIDSHDSSFEQESNPLQSIIQEVATMRKQLKQLQGWIKPIHFGHLDRLSLYANNQFRTQPLQDAVGKHGEAIELIKKCHELGIKQSDIAESWCKEDPKEGEIFLHMTWLAVLSVLARKPSYGREPRQIREKLIKRLRESPRYQGLQRPENIPWCLDNISSDIHLDISLWAEWGPLKAQKENSDPKYYTPSFYVTTNFIQVLAWSHCLLGLAEAGENVTFAFNLLQKSGDQARDTKVLSFGTYLEFTRRLFNKLQLASNWGRKLSECWSEKLLSKSGFNSLPEIANTRNQWAHSKNPTTKQAQYEVNKHQIIIKYLSELIKDNEADLFNNITLSEVSCSDPDILRPVVIENSRGDRFDCGPLMMAPRSSGIGRVFYLPFRIDRSVLQKSSGYISYRRYGASDESNPGYEVKILFHYRLSDHLP